MTKKSCFFIGNRDSSQKIVPLLEEAIEKHISEYGVTEFTVGNYGNFDRLAADAVIRAKRAHPGITLTLLLPYHPAERPVEKPEGFDSTCYPEGMEKVPYRFAVVKANQLAADSADYLIAGVRHSFGNARKLLDYAQKKKKKIVNLCKNEDII